MAPKLARTDFFNGLLGESISAGISTCRLGKGRQGLASELRGVPSAGSGSPSHATSKTAGGFDVVEVAEVVVDADIVQHAAQAAQGDAHAVGPAEAAELARRP